MLKKLLPLLLLIPCYCLANADFKADDISDVLGMASSDVNGVNVITGKYTYSKVDMILPGINPIAIVRTYSYGSFTEIGDGWGLNHASNIYLDENKGYVLLREGVEGTLKLNKRWEGNGLRLFRLDNDAIKKGFTNCSGEISGKTNFKNTKINYYSDSDHCEVKKSNGSVSTYTHRKGKRYIYDLVKERLPSGNEFHYISKPQGYDDNIYMTKILSKTCLDRLLSFVDIQRNHSGWKKGKATLDLIISGYDKQKAEYKVQLDEYFSKLDKVQAPLTPYERYEYDQYCGLTHIYKLDGHVYHIDYYRDTGRNRGKTKTLNAQVGTDRELYRTHTFKYLHKGDDIKKIEVKDAYKNITKYMVNRDHRLESVTRYIGDNKIYSKEEYTWGGKEGNQEKVNTQGNLLSKIVYDQNLNKHSATLFYYDALGNVCNQHMCGIITGRSFAPIEIAGHIIKSGEQYAIHRRFNWQNVPVFEIDSIRRKQITYEYKPESTIITKKLTWIPDYGIVHRQFYEYDAEGILVREIKDNGIMPDAYDLTGVTERHIKCITPYQFDPYGLPGVIEDKYLNLQTGQEELLKKTVIYYAANGCPTLELHYDANGDEIGTVQRTYNEQGKLLTETNPLGQTVETRYDNHGNVIYIQGVCLDSHIERKYDFANRLIEEKEVFNDGRSFAKHYSYNLLSQKISETDEFGNITEFKYDPYGNVLEIKYPTTIGPEQQLVTPTESFTYDGCGNVITKTDAAGYTTSFTYNIRNQVLSKTFPDGTQEKFFYTLDGLLEEVVNVEGVKTRYTHDYFGRVTSTSIISPENVLLSRTHTTYNAFNKTSETDARGIVTHYFYDGAGRLSKVQTEDKTTCYEYDSCGRHNKIIQHYEDGARVTVKVYDLLDRVIEERTEDQNGTVFTKKEFIYDSLGNISTTIEYSEAGASVVTREFDTHGNITSIKDALGQLTLFHFDYSYRNSKNQIVLLETMIDPKGNFVIKEYDTHKRVHKITFKDAFQNILHVQVITYDIKGNKQNVVEEVHTPGSDNVRKILNAYVYDPMNRVRYIVEAVGSVDQKTTELDYNLSGARSIMRKQDGVHIHYAYDMLGRLKTLKATDNSVYYTYGYDKNGNLKWSKDNNDNTVTKLNYDNHNRAVEEVLSNGLTIKHEYDQLDREILQTLHDGSSTRYKYDAWNLKTVERNGLIYSFDYYDGKKLMQSTLPCGKQQKYQYDIMGRKVLFESEHYAENVSYDEVGNITSKKVKDPIGDVSNSFDYDSLYQLKEEKGCFNNHYEHDSLHNRVKSNGTTQSFNDLNQLTENAEGKYKYDLAGNLKTKVSSEGLTEYKYDGLNRLVTVTTPATISLYTYDSFNRRVSKTVNGKQTLYLYDSMNEIGTVEQNELKELRILAPNTQAEHGASLFMEIQGKTYFPVHDQQGNVSILLNQQGNPVETHRYSAYGEEDSDEKSISPWRFCSKRLDEETGFIYFGERYYIPSQGRWLTQDPVGAKDSANLYAYVRNNPLSLSDLHGLSIFFDSDSYYADYYAQEDFMEKRAIHNTLSNWGIISQPPIILHTSFEKPLLEKNNPAYEASAIGVTDGWLDPELALIFENGVGNTREDLESHLKYLSEMSGGMGIFYIYNGTQGVVNDSFEAGINYQEITTEPGQMMHDCYDMALKTLSPTGRFGLITHSQGSANGSNFLAECSPTIGQRTHHLSVAPAKYTFSNTCASVMHLHSIYDPVPKLDFIGAMREFSTTKFLKPVGGGMDHEFQSETYKPYIKKFIDKIKERQNVKDPIK